MTQKDIEALFSPRILGCRMIEQGENATEAFAARMTRYSLETLRDELLAVAKNERAYLTTQQRERRFRNAKAA